MLAREKMDPNFIRTSLYIMRIKCNIKNNDSNTIRMVIDTTQIE